MSQFKLVLNESERSRAFRPVDEADAYFFYEVLKSRASNPNSKFFGAGVQLYENDLCVREFASHDSSSRTAA